MMNIQNVLCCAAGIGGMPTCILGARRIVDQVFDEESFYYCFGKIR
jgi:hypothetical protein